MKRISVIGSLLKKIYRQYSLELLLSLQRKGYTDLRPSFLEVLLFVCEVDGPSIKDIGRACGLKKQTMTSHLNELEKRGYLQRHVNERDKREQNIFLTAYGERFKLSLMESISELERSYADRLGDVELDRVEHLLRHFHDRVVQDELHEEGEQLSIL